MRSTDWSATPLGPREGWPECLRCVLGLALTSRVPMLIAWGAEACLLFNEACAPLLGARRARALGRPGRELPAAVWGVFQGTFEAVLRDGEGGGFEDEAFELATAAGFERRYFCASVSPVKDEAERVRGVLCILSDSTDQASLALRRTGTHRIGSSPARGAQRTEDEVANEARRVAEAERTDRFNELFAGILGHDLRNPLSAITLSAELLARRTRSDEISRPLARILASAERMERMIAQLLDFTRIRLGQGLPLELGPVDLGALARAILDELEPVFGRRIELMRVGSVLGRWDWDWLGQLLSNLAANACQHGAAGAPIVVRLDGGRPDVVTLHVENGGVIPAELLPTLFEPFRHAQSRSGIRAVPGGPRSSGLGLGLHIAEQIVRAHGGSIQVVSGPLSGTCFTVELPRLARDGPDGPAARAVHPGAEPTRW